MRGIAEGVQDKWNSVYWNLRNNRDLRHREYDRPHLFFG